MTHKPFFYDYYSLVLTCKTKAFSFFLLCWHDSLFFLSHWRKLKIVTLLTALVVSSYRIVTQNGASQGQISTTLFLAFSWREREASSLGPHFYCQLLLAAALLLLLCWQFFCEKPIGSSCDPTLRSNQDAL